jgi:hypothetical protein
MRLSTRRALAYAVVSLSALLSTAFLLPAVQAAANHVRWDIIHFNPTTTPLPTVSAGGFAIASARIPVLSLSKSRVPGPSLDLPVAGRPAVSRAAERGRRSAVLRQPEVVPMRSRNL